MQGYQLEYTPAELFRRSILAINAHFTSQAKSFDQLPAEEKDTYLSSLEKGDIDLDGVPSNTFFESCCSTRLKDSSPIRSTGGNKNKIAWKMIGFPGAYADYHDLIDSMELNFIENR